MVTIYKYNSSEIRAVVDPDDNSQQERQIMSQDTVTINITVPVPIDFQIGDYATIFNAKYNINTLPEVRKVAKRDYEYRIILEGNVQDLGKTQYLFLDANNDFTEGKFFLNGTAQDFLKLIVFNLKRVYPSSDWKIGFVVDSGYKNLEFNGNNCLEVLSKLATEFETEWLIEGEKINLYKKQTVSGLVLKYGQNEGLYSITRLNQDNSNIITRVYAFGSNRNIGSNYRNGAQRLRMADSLYLDKFTEKYGVIEATQVFEDVYPRREGIVSSVTSPFIFGDADIDFDVNDYLLPGVTAKLTFNTGQLSGYTFTINTFNNSTKKFTINVNTEEQTIQVPSVDLLPAVGDKYVLTDILMPLEYVDAAEAELKNKAQEYLDQNSVPKLSYSIVCDPIWFKRNSATLNIGQTVGLQDESLGIDREIRVIGHSRNLRRPYLYSVELADNIKQTTIVKLINGI